MATEMKLKDFGYNDKFEKLRIENNFKDFEIGRVISEHKERYIVNTEKASLRAKSPEICGFQQKLAKIFLLWAIG